MKVTDVVKKFLEAEDKMWNTGDGSALLAIEDPNIVVHMFNVPDMKGNQAHVDAIKRIKEGIPGGVTHIWHDITGSGDIGAFRYTESFKIGDKDATHEGSMFLHVKKDKVVEIFGQYDSLALMLASGAVQYVPKPSS
jgi:hypothetical protein